jgi:predicted nucleic acid-binding protein
MLTAPFKVVLDANVLYPFSLRDTLLRAAAAALFQVYWSDEILEETRRNLVKSAAVPAESAAKLIATMRAAFPEACVTGYQSLVVSMKNDPKDAHVAAAAMKAGAQVIVTSNLADFRNLPDGIEAQSPDEFLGNLCDLDREGLVDLLREQAAALRRPPRSFEELIAGLAKIVPDFAASVRAHVNASGAGEPEGEA